MNDKPEPWHEADEKRTPKRGGAPIGTHSLTGGGPAVGLPPTPEDAERSVPDAPGAPEPDPLAEPRANAPGVLGTRR